MNFDRFKRIFLRAARKPAEPTLASVLRYPRRDNELPIVDPKAMLDNQKHQISIIRRQMGQQEGMFRDHIKPLLINYAGFVQMLPASKSYHHSSMGGLFSHGLDAATIAMNLALDTEFVPAGLSSEKKHLEHRYKVAAFIGGLLHDVGKPATDMMITCAQSENIKWNPLVGDLYSWSKDKKIERIKISWQDNRYKKHEALTNGIAPLLMPHSLIEWLTEFGQAPIVDLYMALNEQHAKTKLADVIHTADLRSTEKDHRLEQGNLRGELPNDRIIVDSLRTLLAEKWTVNEPDSIAFYDGVALYIEWPQKGAHELLKYINDVHKIPLPKDPEVLADLIIQYGIAEGEAGKTRYSVAKGRSQMMLKMVSPDSVIETAEFDRILEQEINDKAAAEDEEEEQSPDLGSTVTPGADQSEESDPEAQAAVMQTLSSNVTSEARDELSLTPLGDIAVPEDGRPEAEHAEGESGMVTLVAPQVVDRALLHQGDNILARPLSDELEETGIADQDIDNTVVTNPEGEVAVDEQQDSLSQAEVIRPEEGVEANDDAVLEETAEPEVEQVPDIGVEALDSDESSAAIEFDEPEETAIDNFAFSATESESEPGPESKIEGDQGELFAEPTTVESAEISTDATDSTPRGIEFIDPDPRPPAEQEPVVETLVDATGTVAEKSDSDIPDIELSPSNKATISSPKPLPLKEKGKNLTNGQITEYFTKHIELLLERNPTLLKETPNGTLLIFPEGFPVDWQGEIEMASMPSVDWTVLYGEVGFLEQTDSKDYLTDRRNQCCVVLTGKATDLMAEINERRKVESSKNIEEKTPVEAPKHSGVVSTEDITAKPVDETTEPEAETDYTATIEQESIEELKPITLLPAIVSENDPVEATQKPLTPSKVPVPDFPNPEESEVPPLELIKVAPAKKKSKKPRKRQPKNAHAKAQST